MKEFLNEKYKNLHPYMPGEQLQDRKYIKLNANESSLPPSPEIKRVINESLFNHLGQYNDPYCTEFRQALAEVYGISKDNIFVGNGSDEILGLLFMTFFGGDAKVCFPDITYGFYESYCDTFNIDAKKIPLNHDFEVDIKDYLNEPRHIILANPNSPIGKKISQAEIEELLKADPNRLVVVDEAYVDYHNDSCLPLVVKYPNLIVVQTFSKSRNLAGARIGFGAADKKLIDQMRNIKFAFNPYNLSSLSQTIGIAAVFDENYLKQMVQMTLNNKIYLSEELEKMGFYVIESHTNFIMVRPPQILSAKNYYEKLKQRGILTRYYSEERIHRFLRITIGTRAELNVLISQTKQILNQI